MTRPADPLFDALFRPTTLSPTLASAAPVRAAGTRSRAGNAMSRTRAALLDGARRAVEVNGTKITMAQVAAAAGVAKGTLYNHFRTREAVLAALLDDEVTRLVEHASGLPVADALRETAASLAQHPLVHALRRIEPGVVAALACVDDSAPGWRQARTAAESALAADGRAGADTVLRWLSSYLTTPAAPAAIAADLAVVLTGLPDAPRREATVPPGVTAAGGSAADALPA